MLEETVEGDSFVPQERVQQRTVDVPILEAFERDSRGGHWLFMNEWQQRTAEQIVDVPQFREETVEAVRLVP